MIELLQLSSVENILPKFQQIFTQISSLRVLSNEHASWQIACRMDHTDEYRIELESDILPHLTLYRVGCVPVMRAVFNPPSMEDPQYLSHEPGIYPDVLYPMQDSAFRGTYHYQGFWIATDGAVPPGKHIVTVTVRRGEESAQVAMTLTVLPQALPPQQLKYCIPIHGDCLSQYYGIEVFSEAYWEMLEKYIRFSVCLGSNMLVVPVITPPVDTAVGGERLTVQLVKIRRENGVYFFDFTLLHRFIRLCTQAGITDFFMPQFFTQWGAQFCPKIVITEDGVQKSCFGWDTESTDPTYLYFLRQFLPALTEELRLLGIAEHTMFSISDEPFGEEAVARYATLTAFMKPYLEGFPIIDAFTDYNHFLQSGAQIPLIPTDAIRQFQDHIRQPCVYYCCAQDCLVSNRFIAMPGYRNRCFGYQLYRYDVAAFFHWALNFYNAQLSVRPIDPYQVTDADGGYPAGDAFSVYPGPEGPIPSTRSMVFREALEDLRALRLLESRIGRSETLKLLESWVGKVTFDRCAPDAQTILRFRHALLDKLEELPL